MFGISICFADGEFIPPVGIIATSVLYATIIIFGMAGLSIGLDISGILHELNEMKRLKIEEFKTDEEG